jgi:hypothetical protein
MEEEIRIKGVEVLPKSSGRAGSNCVPAVAIA